MKQFLLFLAIFCMACTGLQAQRISSTVDANDHYLTKKSLAYDLSLSTSSTNSQRGSDLCSAATDISALLGGAIGETINSDIFDNSDAGTGADDPTDGFDCFQDTQAGPVLENTEWFTFVGDGNTYAIRTSDCGAANPMPGNDSQIAIYSGDCNNLVPVACNEDENFPANIFNGLVIIGTQVGVTYYVMVDGWDGTVGEYCVTVTALEIVTCDQIASGEGTLQDEDGIFCLGEIVSINLDGNTALVSPPVGVSAFRWIVGTQDATGAANPFAVPGLLGAFGAQTDGVNLSFINDQAISGIPPGVYFFTPVAYSNATVPADGMFSGFTFENGCIAGGASIMVTLTTDPDVPELTVASLVEIVIAGTDTTGSVNLNVTGGSGENTYLWSNGETTPNVTGLAEGTYTVTVSDPSPCVASVVRTITVVFPSESATNEICFDAFNLDTLLGGDLNVTISSGIFDNTDSDAEGDPDFGFECFFDPNPNDAIGQISASQWYTFVGDGNVYEIRTSDCGAANPMDGNDSQIAVYSGTSCNDLTAVACNEDEGAAPLFNGFVSILTEVGVTYYILVDGWNDTRGEYCVQFTQIEGITCNDASAPQGEAASQTLCIGDTLMLNITDDFTLPVGAPGSLTEFRWVFAPQDISGSDNPFVDGFGGFIWFGPSGGTYNISTFVYNGGVGNPVAPGVYFLTPIAYSGATSPTPTMFATYNFDDACFVTGNSIEITMLPALAPLSVTLSSTPEDETIPELGSATATVTGGSGGRAYLWSNGETTQTITGLVAGEYTVTVSDLTGCVDDVIETVVVSFVSSVNDPALGAAVSLYPNPAADFATFQYNFQDATDLQINVTNTLGQTLMTKQINNAQQGREALEISHLAPGTYFVRFSNGESQAVKQLVIIR